MHRESVIFTILSVQYRRTDKSSASADPQQRRRRGAVFDGCVTTR
ncbi:hypothetical protein BN2537_17021 [Streptomyces venezuelae]|nr:hypothetical protein BN2537_17021 [Streptomyces venezuelae]